MAATQHNRPYDPAEVESIKHMLEAEAREGKPLSFDVKIDGMTRIHKTDKVERFNELYNFINENTKDLVISIYPDHTNRKEWYKYSFGESSTSNGLNGIDVDQKVRESMQLFEERHAAKMTEEKLKQVQSDLKEAEEYIGMLTAQLEEAKIKPNHFGKFDLAQLAGDTLTSVAKNYPKVLDDVPVLNGIAKVIQRDAKQQLPNQQSSFQGEVSFKPKQAKQTLSPEAEAHEQTVRQMVDYIGDRFDSKQRRILGHVIIELGEKPAQLTTVAELLNIDVHAVTSDVADEAEEEEEETEY